MSTAQLTTSVIIAGAGPVGLALACELGMRGVDCMLIEKRDGAIKVPKQSMVSSRNMEFCRRWGVAAAVRNAVWPESHPRDFIYLENLRGRELLRVKMPAYVERDPNDYTPEAPCPCPQIYFDPILTARVQELASVTARYNTSLTAFHQDDGGVIAELCDFSSGATQTLRAKFLVGCDGPAGTVREALGIELEGIGAIANSVNLYFRSPSLPAFHDKGWARFYRVIDETGCWAELIPIDGKELWRLTVFDDPASSQEPGALLRKMAGGTFPYEMLNVARWERRDYVARSYGHGRAFIAGDAAHECSPTGGIGMHTGLEEVINLAWKIAAVLEGWGAPGLLSTYELERRPIAVRNVNYATRTYDAIAGIPGWPGAQDTSAWARTTLSIPEHLKLQYCYEDLPICMPDGSVPEPDTPEFEPSTRPGSRAPHAWLADGRSTIDLYGDGFVLVRAGANAPDAARLIAAATARQVPLTEVTIDDAAIAALYARKLVLVRPDGHVAWRGDECPADAGAIIDRVRGATIDASPPRAAASAREATRLGG